MRQKVRVLLSAFIVLSIVALSALVFYHYQSRGKYRIDLPEQGNIEVRVQKIRYSGTKDGKVEWELEAESATRSKNRPETVFEDIVLVFYAKDGTPYRLKAERGSYNEKSGKITASGKVSVATDEGYSVDAPELTYDLGKRLITSDGRVAVLYQGIDLEGTGLFVDVDKGLFTLKDAVRARISDGVI